MEMEILANKSAIKKSDARDFFRVFIVCKLSVINEKLCYIGYLSNKKMIFIAITMKNAMNYALKKTTFDVLVLYHIVQFENQPDR